MQVLLRRAGVCALAALALAIPASSTASQSAPVARAAQDYQVPLPPYLTPIPIVRLSGSTTHTGSRINLLRVKAPRGSKVTVRCSGGKRRGCKVSRKARIVPKSRLVRFREFERRLRSGVRLQVFVNRGNTIGKYTSFKIRARKAPVRTDSCLFPGDPSEPASCP